MAYVPGFLHDVFISYARANDPDLTGVVGKFHELLSKYLPQESLKIKGPATPDGVDIFVDGLRGKSGDSLTEQILAGARSSAVFIAFHSEPYLDSAWCMGEANEFTAHYDQDRKNFEGRLFVITLRATSPQDHPIKPFRDRPFVNFYYVRGGRDFSFTGDPTQRNATYTFDEEVRNLAREIAPTLKRMKAEPTRPAVFIADTSATWKNAASSIKDWLLQQRVHVFRASPEEPDWETQSRDLIDRADFYIDFYEAEPHATAAKQAELATQSGIPRLRWLPRGQLPAEQSVPALLQATLVEERLEAFQDMVLEKLPKVGAGRRPAQEVSMAKGTQAPPPPRPGVLLVGARRDNAFIRQVAQKLRLMEYVHAAFVTEDTDERSEDWLKKFEKELSLNSPRNVIFIEGDCNVNWSEQCFRDLLLLLRGRQDSPRRALWVFPPRPKSSWHPRRDLNAYDEFNETDLDRLEQILAQN